jgi:hypothetical protein
MMRREKCKQFDRVVAAAAIGSQRTGLASRLQSRTEGAFGMIARSLAFLFCLAVMTCGLPVTSAKAQEFSPYFETTGRGAYDLFRDALLCSALIKLVLDTDSDHPDPGLLATTRADTEDFARFLLDTGNVIDRDGAILSAEDLGGARRTAQTDWEERFVALREDREAMAAEIDRCLRLYSQA